MNVSLAERLWKIIFIVFNSIFILFGFILFVIGIKAQTTFAKYNTIIQASTPAIFPTIIFTGIFSILTGCIGFVGVFKQKPIFFILHLVGLGVATIIDFAIATASAVVHDKFPIMAHDALRSAVRYYYYRHDIQTDFDKLQGNLKCCGATSFLDYTRMGANVPFSCRIGDLVYAEGCVHVLSELVQHYIIVIISLCFVFAIIQSIFLIISILLFRKSEAKLGSV